MTRIARLLLPLWLWPAFAFAQSAPSRDMLEGQIIHWVGAETTTLQNTANDLAKGAGGQPITLPFADQSYGSCRMINAALIIRRDGSGEFLATTYTSEVHANAVWHTIISLYDERGRLLFGTGDFTGPVMDDGRPNVHHMWVNRFTMDAATLASVYKRIDHAALAFAC